MKTYFTFMKESHTLYHNSYTGAVNAALQKHSDLKVSPEDRDTHIAMGPRKPAEGETVKHNIPATDKNGDPHMIHIQVYNKGGNTPFELNTYSSKVPKKKVAEETEMRHSSDSLGDHMALKAYANKLGPKHIDRHDLLTAASHMAFGNMDHLKKHLKALDTDVRDKALEYVARRHHAELGYSVRKEEADIDEALGTIKNMKAASKFGSSNVSDMIRGEKARKAGMAKVSTTKDIGYKVVDVGPGQKETIRKMHNFKEEPDQIHEEHMSEKDAESLAQKHVNAAISAKKSGNLAGYYAHAEASNYIRDKILTHTYSPKGIPSVKIRSTAKKLFGELSEHRIKEANQIDELKHSGGVLNNYLSKTNPDRNTPEDNEKRAAGRGLALGKKWGKALGVNEPKVPATNEEVELDELDHGGIISRYIRKAGPGGSESFPKRKKGVDLALLKKWGDKGYGLPEPKVKAVQREEIEPLAEISAALARRASRASMDE
jgi:hypothetical protein